jgi:hypothetical protein
VIAGETAGRQGAAPPPPPYVERFRRFRPAVTVTVGGVALVMSSVWLVHAARSAHLGEGPPALALLFTSIAMVGLGAARLIHGYCKGWMAFAVDADGIYFADCVYLGSRPGGEARRLSWGEVSALVLFSRRTEVFNGAVKCVGVRLNPSVAGSPEDHLARLNQLLSQPDLERHVWEQLRELDGDPAESRLGTAVSLHAEARGWRYRQSRILEAVRAHAPDVPVITFTADDFFHLVGWRADQEKAREILEDAELRRCGW